jgi:hypothetical protein
VTGEPERTEQPRRARASPWTNPPRSRKHGFFGGRKPLERRVEAGRFSRKAQERSGELETGLRITEKEESSEGRSPRVLDPERGIQGMGELGSRREGSQTLRVELLQSRATFWRRWVERHSEKEGPPMPEMLKGQKA